MAFGGRYAGRGFSAAEIEVAVKCGVVFGIQPIRLLGRGPSRPPEPHIFGIKYISFPLTNHIAIPSPLQELQEDFFITQPKGREKGTIGDIFVSVVEMSGSYRTEYVIAKKGLGIESNRGIVSPSSKLSSQISFFASNFTFPAPPEVSSSSSTSLETLLDLPEVEYSSSPSQKKTPNLNTKYFQDVEYLP